MERFVVALEQRGNDVVRGGLGSIDFQSRHGRQPVVLWVAAALVEQRREVVDQFAHRPASRLLVGGVPSPAALHAQVSIGKECDVGIGKTDGAAEHHERERRSKVSDKVCRAVLHHGTEQFLGRAVRVCIDPLGLRGENGHLVA